MTKIFPLDVLLSVVNMSECGETAFVTDKNDLFRLYEHFGLPEQYFATKGTWTNSRSHELEIIGRKVQNQHPTLVLPYTEMQLFFGLKRAYSDMKIPYNTCSIPIRDNEEYLWIWHAMIEGFVKQQEKRLGFGLYPISQ